MKVLSIDPSTTSLGWAILEDDDDEISLLDYGALQFEGGDTLLDRLNKVYMLFFKVVSEHSPQLLSLEKTWRVDRGSVALVAAIKVIKETADLVEGLRVIQANAMSVRKEFGCGARDSATAKERVRKYILTQFDIEPDHPSDVYDAIILGLYGINKG